MDVMTESHSSKWRMRKRLLWCIVLLTVALPSPLLAEALTEDQAIDMGLGHSHFNQLLHSQADAARGEALTSKTWLNPALELSREETGNETETSFWIRQRFNLSGQRKLNSEAANSQLSAIEAANQVARLERKNQIRNHFYQLLFQQQQHQLFTHWVAKFSTVEAAMEKREMAGDVSGYDHRRISRERITLVAQQRTVEADYHAAKEHLYGLIGLSTPQTLNDVEGTLIPNTPPSLESLMQGLGNHPALIRLQHRSESAHLLSRAAVRSRIPDVTLGIGQKSADSPGNDESGFMLSASVPLPLFDRKQGQRQRATANAVQAESEYQLALQQSQADLRALWYQARQLSENARLFKEESLAISYELVRIAEAAYHADEIGVLELIDAYRSALDAETTAHELALKARLARIELDQIIEGILP